MHTDDVDDDVEDHDDSGDEGDNFDNRILLFIVDRESLQGPQHYKRNLQTAAATTTTTTSTTTKTIVTISYSDRRQMKHTPPP